MRHLHHICFAARVTRHGLTAQGVRLDLWQGVGEFASGQRSIAALVRTVVADLNLCDSLDAGTAS